MTEAEADRDLALKGDAVEEWLDLVFFRPAGIRVARALLPTAVTPNQVTLASVAVGAVAGHLFFYRSPAANAAGLVLVVAADVLDSADGQLARLRGTSSRWGRVLDGYADSVRWAVIYAHLLARVVRDGGGTGAAALAVAAGFCHSLQAAAIDFAYSAYTVVTAGRGTLDLPEEFGGFALPRVWWAAVARGSYLGYARRQVRMLPRTAALLRLVRRGDPGARARFAPAYAAAQGPTMRLCALLGQNAHLALLGAATLGGRPAWFFAGVVALGTPILAAVIGVHERRARALARVWGRLSRNSSGAV
jgi:phosphatidylserine synthase